MHLDFAIDQVKAMAPQHSKWKTMQPLRKLTLKQLEMSWTMLLKTIG